MSFAPTVEMRRKLERFSNLPSAPQIIVKIRQVSDDPRSTTADLATCILSDHQLTGHILRTANSAYYGEFAGKINTVLSQERFQDRSESDSNRSRQSRLLGSRPREGPSGICMKQASPFQP